MKSADFLGLSDRELFLLLKSGLLKISPGLSSILAASVELSDVKSRILDVEYNSDPEDFRREWRSCASKVLINIASHRDEAGSMLEKARLVYEKFSFVDELRYFLPEFNEYGSADNVYQFGREQLVQFIYERASSLLDD